MKMLFDETKCTRWYIRDDGSAFSERMYQREVIEKEKQLTANKQRGYLYIRTSSGNYQVHRLVASAFIPNPHNKPCVNHKDCNKHNNKKSNLEWVTHKENILHSIKNGRIKLFDKNEGNNLKYTNLQCIKVLKRIASGMTYKEAGEKYNMPYSTVAHLARGSRRRV